jgi:hypothetical protein
MENVMFAFENAAIGITEKKESIGNKSQRDFYVHQPTISGTIRRTGMVDGAAT